MSSRHSIPPTTTAQYLTAGLVVIFLEILFVVLSNEAQVLTDNEVKWYNPLQLISFANDQLKINNCDMPVNSITLQQPKNKADQMYVFVVDQTCPVLVATYQKYTFNAFLENAQIQNVLNDVNGQRDSLRDLLKRTKFQNQIDAFLLGQMLKEKTTSFSYGIIDYNATNDSKTTLAWRGREGLNYTFDFPKTDRETDKKPILYHACNDMPVKDKGKQTNFSDFFMGLSGKIIEMKKQSPRTFGLHLIIISDFVHETEGLKHTSYENVKNNLAIFSAKHTDVKTLKLIIMPFHEKNNHLVSERKKLVQYIKGNMQAAGVKTDAIDLDDFESEEELINSLKIIGTQMCDSPQDSIVMYYPFSTREYPGESYGKLFVENADRKICWKLDCNNPLAESAEIPLMQCCYDSGNILVNTRLYTETKQRPDTMTLSFQSSNFANDYNGLHIDMMSDGYSIMPLPIKFVKKMTLIEASILGASTLLILVFFIYWLMLLLSGRSFYEDVEQHDWVSKLTCFIRENYFQIGAFISIVVPILLCGILIITSLNALDKSAQIWLILILIAYVGITSWFHNAHLRRQEEVLKKQADKKKRRLEIKGS